MRKVAISCIGEYDVRQCALTSLRPKKLLLNVSYAVMLESLQEKDSTECMCSRRLNRLNGVNMSLVSDVMHATPRLGEW